MRVAFAGLLAAMSLAVSAGAPSMTSAVSGSWSGTYALRSEDSLGLVVRGRSVLVALGAGHASAQSVPLSASGGRLRFRLPGRPGPIVFDGRVRGSRISGTVRQAGRRGSFRVQRGPAPRLLARGWFADGHASFAVVDTPFGVPRLLDLDSGEVRGLYRRDAAFEIGSGFATRAPSAGTASFGATAAVIRGRAAARLGIRQLEVLFASGGATLAGTLTLPPGRGPHPAVAWVHGSGPQSRSYLPDLPALLVHHGMAVLAYDKRGIGQSGGFYPGEAAHPSTIDLLARDAAAAVRFLAAQPEIDFARVGLAGHSQGGWIIPLAARREPKVRFLISFAGPAVTVDESDLYQDLTGQGDRAQELADDAVDAEVLRRGPGGFDPMPSIRALRIPALWVYGGLDKHIPTRLSTRLLEPVAAEPGRDVSIMVFPNANHALVETQTGLTAEMLRSDRFAPGLFARVGDWLKSRGLGSS